ncbi:MAG: methyltransferase domain-containing protein [Planctomycetota bacterium]
MTEYILTHSNEHEAERLDRMARLFDPQMHVALDRIGVGPGWRCLEVAAGAGHIGRWLADRVGPDGHVVVSDIDTSLFADATGPNLEVKQIDLRQDDLGGGYDLVCGRAFLHHLPQRRETLDRLAEALKPGGWLVLVEPDFHTAAANDNAHARALWEGLSAWGADQSIDHYVGRRLGGWMVELGLETVELRGETILFQGGTEASKYWRMTFEQIGPRLLASGVVSQADYDETLRLWDEPVHWNWPCQLILASGRKPLS